MIEAAKIEAWRGGLPRVVTWQLDYLIESLEREYWAAAFQAARGSAEVLLKVVFAGLAADALELEPQESAPRVHSSADEDLRRQLASLVLKGTRTLGTVLYGIELVLRSPKLLTPLSADLGQRLSRALLSSSPGGTPLKALQSLRDLRNRKEAHALHGDVGRAKELVSEALPHLERVFAALAPIFMSLELGVDDNGQPAPSVEPNEPIRWDGLSLRPFLVFAAPSYYGRDFPCSLQFFHGLERRNESRMLLWDGRSGFERKLRHEKVQWPELAALMGRARSHDPLKLGSDVAPVRATSPGISMGWLHHLEDVLFSGFDAGRYLEPVSRMKRLEEILDRPQGTTLVVGPSGVGKSFLLRGLVDRLRSSPGPPRIVLPVFLLPGEGSVIEVLQHRLSKELYEEGDRLRELGVYVQNPPPGFLHIVEEWLEHLLAQRDQVMGLVLLIDGLSDLPPESASELLGCLPGHAPRGLHLVVTAREAETSGQEVGTFEAITWSERLRLDPSDHDHSRLLKTFLAERLPQLSPGAQQELLDRARGSFLHLDHFVRWLELFPSSELPGPAEFYSRVLAWVSEQAQGYPRFGRTVERTLLTLAAALEPLTVEALVESGVEEGLVEEALITLRHFLARERSAGGSGDYTYRLEHAELHDYLCSSAWATRLQSLHVEWGSSLLADRLERAEPFAWGDPADEYAAAHLGAHLVAGGDSVPLNLRREAVKLVGPLLEHIEGLIADQENARALSVARCALLLAETSTSHLGGAALVSGLRREVRAACWVAAAARSLQLLDAAIEAAGVASDSAVRLLKLAPSMSALRFVAEADATQANVTRELGDLKRALALYTQCAERYTHLDRNLPAARRPAGGHLRPDDRRALAAAHHGVALTASALSDPELAARHAKEGAQLLRGLGTVEDQLGLSLLLGFVDSAKSLAAIRKARATWGDTPAVLSAEAQALYALAGELGPQGEFDQALELVEECLCLLRDLKGRFSATLRTIASFSQSLGQAALLARRSGNLDRAEKYAREALEICQEAAEAFGRTPRSLGELSFSLARLADVFREADDLERASELYSSCHTVTEEWLSWGPNPQALRQSSVVSLHLARHFAEKEDCGAAAALCEEAVGAGERLSVLGAAEAGDVRQLAYALRLGVQVAQKAGEEVLANCFSVRLGGLTDERTEGSAPSQLDLGMSAVERQRLLMSAIVFRPEVSETLSLASVANACEPDPALSISGVHVEELELRLLQEDRAESCAVSIGPEYGKALVRLAESLETADIARALTCYERAADLGNTRAMARLGLVHCRGRVVTRDCETAESWFSKAAAGGLVAGLLGLGGCRLKRRLPSAFAPLLKAADQGEAQAMRLLHFCYSEGIGTEANPQEGERWLARAVEDKDGAALVVLAQIRADNPALWVEAQALLAEALERGAPGADDYRERQEALARACAGAARAGHAKDQATLATRYALGFGVPQDLAIASEWGRRAVESGTWADLRALELLAETEVPSRSLGASVEARCSAGRSSCLATLGAIKILLGEDAAGAAWLERAALVGSPGSTRDVASFVSFLLARDDSSPGALGWIRAGLDNDAWWARERWAEFEARTASDLRLANAGEPSAMLRLVEHFLEARGVEQDLGAACVWFERAEAAGAIELEGHSTCVTLLQGFDRSPAPLLVLEASAYRRSAHEEHARYLRSLRELAEAGGQAAALAVGESCLRDGQTDAARHWFQLEQARASPHALFRLGQIHLQSLPDPYPEVADWVRQAKTESCPASAWVKLEEEAAADLKAAEVAVGPKPSRSLRLAYRYACGWGLPRDLGKATTLALQASGGPLSLKLAQEALVLYLAALGEAEALVQAAIRELRVGDRERAHPLLRRAAETANHERLAELGAACLDYGEAELGMGILAKAAEGPQHLELIASAYLRHGKHELWRQYLQRAADGGSQVGMRRYGLLLDEEGEREEALKWLLSAAQMGSFEAERWLHGEGLAGKSDAMICLAKLRDAQGEPGLARHWKAKAKSRRRGVTELIRQVVDRLGARFGGEPSTGRPPHDEAGEGPRTRNRD